MSMRRTLSDLFSSEKRGDGIQSNSKSLRRVVSISSFKKPSTMRKIRGSMRSARKSRRHPMATSSNASVLQSAHSSSTRAAGRGRVFGVDLEELMGSQKMAARKGGSVERMSVPVVINKFVEHLIYRGLHEKGLFRVAGSKEQAGMLRQQLDRGAGVDLYKTSTAVIADLLKTFLRELPLCLLDSRQWDAWMEAAAEEDRQQRISKVRRILARLPESHQATSTVLFSLLKMVADNSAETFMDEVNLAKVMGPNILQMTGEAYDPLVQLNSLGLVTDLVTAMITDYDTIFKPFKSRFFVIRTINIRSALKASGISTPKVDKPVPRPPATSSTAAEKRLPPLPHAPAAKRSKNAALYEMEISSPLPDSPSLALKRSAEQLVHDDSENAAPNSPSFTPLKKAVGELDRQALRVHHNPSFVLAQRPLGIPTGRGEL